MRLNLVLTQADQLLIEHLERVPTRERARVLKQLAFASLLQMRSNRPSAATEESVPAPRHGRKLSAANALSEQARPSASPESPASFVPDAQKASGQVLAQATSQNQEVMTASATVQTNVAATGSAHADYDLSQLDGEDLGIAL